MYMCIDIYVSISIWIWLLYIYTHTQIYIYIPIHMNTYIYISICIYVYIDLDLDICIYMVYIYIHTYIHIYLLHIYKHTVYRSIPSHRTVFLTRPLQSIPTLRGWSSLTPLCPPTGTVALYTMFLLPIWYGVWHTHGRSEGGVVYCLIVAQLYCTRVGNAGDRVE